MRNKEKNNSNVKQQIDQTETIKEVTKNDQYYLQMINHLYERVIEEELINKVLQKLLKHRELFNEV